MTSDIPRVLRERKKNICRFLVSRHLVAHYTRFILRSKQNRMFIAGRKKKHICALLLSFRSLMTFLIVPRATAPVQIRFYNIKTNDSNKVFILLLEKAGINV